MKTSKITLNSNNKLIIENYHNIIDLSNEYIIVDNYNITGINLKIKEMDEYYIIIDGVIKTIELLSDDK